MSSAVPLQNRYNIRMPLLIAAASSLTDVLKPIGQQFTAKTSIPITFTFGASGTLLRQIQAGAPIDVFVSAAPQEIDQLEKAGLLLPDTRRIVAANRLVLITPPRGTMKRWEDLSLPPVRRIAMGNTRTVPAGRYAKEVLTRRKLWDGASKKAVYAQNVRQVLAYVASGDTDAGIVFRTDALSEKRVRIAAVATPMRDHDPIVYPAAVIGRSTQPETARQFVAALGEKEAQALFTRFGFLSPSHAA